MRDDDEIKEGFDQCEHCKEDFPSDELIYCEACGIGKCEGDDDTYEEHGGKCADCLLDEGIDVSDDE